MLSVSTGYDPGYLTRQVGTGREGYYLRAVREGGEPPGRWVGPGAEALGLVGEVDPTVMEALYQHFVDPRDERVSLRGEWDQAAKLGKPPRRFRGLEERLAAALEKEPDASPERVEEIRAQIAGSQRQAVHFLDLTFSPQKSVSVLWASFAARAAEHDAAAEALASQLAEAPEGGAERRRLEVALGAERGAADEWRRRAGVVWDAIEAGADAMLDYARQEAGYSRAGYHGRLASGATVGRYVEARDWIVARFAHHESRDHDVQLHLHHAVLNRVQCEDGEWRTLDSRAIHRVRPAAAAVGERVVEDYLSRELGVEWATRADGKAREIVGMGQEFRDLFSTRRAAIRERLAELVAWYEQRHGREPDALTLSRLSLMATLDSRNPKRGTRLSRDEQVAGWVERVDQTLGLSLSELAEQVTGRVDAEAVAEAFDPAQVIAAAVARVQEGRSTWTRYDLIRALNVELPDMLGSLGPDHITALLDDLADAALTDQAHGVVQLTAPDLVEVPDELRRADGESVYRPHRAQRYATAAHLAAEGRLEDAAGQRRAPSMSAERVDELVADAGLGGDQYAAVLGILTSGRGVDVLVGPPGTGKSYTVAQLAAAWETEHGVPVLGLATSQRAADVLAEEGVGRTANLAKFLQAQQRLSGERVSAQFRARWQLQPGQLVVVDEAGMTTTDDLAAVEEACRQAGAKLVLSGDPQQLAAVGAGGAMRLLSLGDGEPYVLHQVRRFGERWERDASLRLRDRDVSVLAEYDKHGRILGGDQAEMVDAAVRGYLADTLAGRDAVLITSTNAAAAQVSAQVRAEMVTLGRVEAEGVPLRDGNRAGVGDRIQTRKNRRDLVGPDGHEVTNRDTYTVVGRRTDGELIVRRETDGAKPGSELTLPADYVRDYVELAYAMTAHGAQGETVDRGHLLVDGSTDPAGVLVGLTRGRGRNTAYVLTDPAGDGQNRPTPVGVLAGILRGAQVDQSATEAMREELSASERLDQLGGAWADLVDRHYRARVEAAVRRMLPAEVADRVLADPAVGPLVRRVQAVAGEGHDVVRVLAEAIHRGGRARLLRADHIARALHWRVGQVISGAGPTPARPGVVGVDVLAAAEAALRAELPPAAVDRVLADPACPALWRMVAAAAEATGAAPGEIVRDAVHHPGKGGRDSLLAEAESVAGVLHWRVADGAGPGVDPVYRERWVTAAVPAVQPTLDGDLAPAGPVDEVGLVDEQAGWGVAAVSPGQVVLDLPGVAEPGASVGGYLARTPVGMSGPVGRYARDLAAVCDERAAELGELAAAARPAWAAALGPVPDDPVARVEWTHRAGAVAAWREQYGHRLADDQPLGVCPAEGNVPARQAWQAAWEALGRPEQVREAATLTDVQLRERVAVWRREQAWAPDYVADELRKAEQAAADYAARAEIARAELDAGRVAETDRAAAQARAEGYRALADGLAARVSDLSEIDAARAAWYAETTPAREAAEQAATELRRRGQDPGQITRREQAADPLARLRARAGEQHRRDQDAEQARRDQARGDQLTLDLPGVAKPAGREHEVTQARAVDEQERHLDQLDQQHQAEQDRQQVQHPDQLEMDLPGLREQTEHAEERRATAVAERNRERDQQRERDGADRQAEPAERDRVRPEAQRAERLAARAFARQHAADGPAEPTAERGEQARDAAARLARARAAVVEVHRRQAERAEQARAEQARRDSGRLAAERRAARQAERGGPVRGR